jgi:hypothetical protein
MWRLETASDGDGARVGRPSGIGELFVASTCRGVHLLNVVVVGLTLVRGPMFVYVT